MLKNYSYKIFLAAISLVMLTSPVRSTAGTDPVEPAAQATGEIMLAPANAQATAEAAIASNASTAEVISDLKGTGETFLEMLSDTASARIFPNAGSLESLIKGADAKNEKKEKQGRGRRRRSKAKGPDDGKPLKTTAEIEAEKYYEYPQLTLESSTFEALLKKLAGTVETVLPKTKKAVEEINSKWDKRWADRNAPTTEEIEAVRVKVAAATLEAELKRKRRERRMPVTEEVKIESGADIFMRYCDGCHSDFGKTFYSGPLKGRPFWTKYPSGAGLGEVIRNGVRGERGDMPRYGREKLSDKELEALIEHIKSLTQPLEIKNEEPKKTRKTAEVEIMGSKEGTKEVGIKVSNEETKEIELKAVKEETQEADIKKPRPEPGKVTRKKKPIKEIKLEPFK